MDFTETVQTVWNMLWTNTNIMEKKKRKNYFPGMKDFSSAMKCLGEEICQMYTTAGPEVVVSYSVSKGFFLTYEALYIAEGCLLSGNSMEFFPQALHVPPRSSE